MQDVEKQVKNIAWFFSGINEENTSVVWGGLPLQQKEGIGGGKGTYSKLKKGRWKRIGENKLQARDNEENGRDSIDMLKH